jgi:hypothetical protein
VTNWEDLAAAKMAAEEALADAEKELLAELAAAKAAFRKSKSEANERRHAEAVQAVAAYRAVVRADRAGVGVIANQDGEG